MASSDRQFAVAANYAFQPGPLPMQYVIDSVSASLADAIELAMASGSFQAETSEYLQHLKNQNTKLHSENYRLKEWKDRRERGCPLCGSLQRGGLQLGAPKACGGTNESGDARLLCGSCSSVMREEVAAEEKRWKTIENDVHAASITSDDPREDSEDEGVTQDARVYFARDLRGGNLIKIGISVRIERRMKELNAECILDLPGGRRVEEELHQRFSKHRSVGEWFKPEKELVDFIFEMGGDISWLPEEKAA